MTLSHRTTEVERIEDIAAVEDDDGNQQSPANTAEQQATQDAIDAAKNELLSKLDTVGADPIEVRGSPVDIRLADGEQTTVPDGVAWVVTLHPGNDTVSVCSIEYTPPGMDPTYEANPLTASSADKGFSNGTPETVLHAGGIISVSSNGAPGHLFGWEVSI